MAEFLTKTDSEYLDALFVAVTDLYRQCLFGLLDSSDGLEPLLRSRAFTTTLHPSTKGKISKQL